VLFQLKSAKRPQTRARRLDKAIASLRGCR
jgi:uncharacterized protein YdeI (YjbR/CyaY-like superfamily)